MTEINEIQTMSTPKGVYNSFPDLTARAEIEELKKGNGSGQNVDLSAVLETVPGNNLMDTSALVTSFVDSAGVTVTGTFSNYIPVKKGLRYVTNVTNTRYDYFDSDKNHISNEWDGRNPKIFTPAQDGYLLIQLPADYSGAIVLAGTDIGAYRPAHRRLKLGDAQARMHGKRLLVIGDSISTDEDIYASDGYGKLISRELEMEMTNISVSGKTSNWGYDQLDGLADEYDVIAVMLGTNDHGYNCAIGALNDDAYAAGAYDSGESFYARMQLLVEKLRAKFPRSLILMLTPIKRTAVGGGASNNDAGYQINALGLTTEAYRDAIIEVCDYYSIPCVDLYNAIDPRTEVNRELYFMSVDDGTHPNDLGHALYLAPVIRDAILRHTPYVFPEWSEEEEPDAPVEPGEPGGDTDEAVLLHRWGTGVKGETLEDTVDGCDMTAVSESHYVYSNAEGFGLARGESFSIKSKTTINTVYPRLFHQIHTGGSQGIHTMAGNTPYDMTGRFFCGFTLSSENAASFGDAYAKFYYLTAHDSAALSVPIYGTKAVPKGTTTELALTWDAETSVVRLYQDGELIGEEVTSVPLAVDGINVRANYVDTDSSPCEYIELYKGVIEI